MLVKRFPTMLWVMIASLLGAAACTPTVGSEVGAIVTSSATENSFNQADNTGGGVVIEITPMSETELAAQPPGQSEPGAGGASGGSETEPGAQGEQPGTRVVYTDRTYKFEVDSPADFVFHTQPAEKLAQLDPMPDASFSFMNPVTAASDLADLEPADLEIRVYVAGQIASLESWLTSVGLLPADGTIPLQPFQTANVSGVQMCASTMIAPGCSYFVYGSGWVYQLTPATLEGETMVNTFKLIP